MEMDKRYINQIEVLTNIFTIDKNSLKVLLVRRMEEPYKGYWMLPSNLLMTTETIESCALDTAEEYLGIRDIYFKNCNIFSKIDRLPNDRIVANSLIGLVDSETLVLKKKNTNYNSAWFSIEEIPKMVFDHSEILMDSVEYLKNQLTNPDMLKKLFPTDFTLPELQIVYEQILNKKLDRRNFRKKILNSGLLIDTGYKDNKKTGRPAVLYQFKDQSDLKMF